MDDEDPLLQQNDSAMQVPTCSHLQRDTAAQTITVFGEETFAGQVGQYLSARRDRCTITVLTGPALGHIFSVQEYEQIVLGRSPELQACIADVSMSRRHARITFRKQALYVEDLKSKNGTYHEGRPIHGIQHIADGDRIQLGANTLVQVDLQDAIEQEALRQVHEWTVRDPLTRLYNRRYLDERLVPELSYSVRHGNPISLLLLDVDHFKQINDNHSHQAGDAVLSVIAEFLLRVTRSEDVAARYGGEEFAILLRNTQHNHAVHTADRIRQGISSFRIPWQEHNLRITVSIGIATSDQLHPLPSPHELVAAADHMLYRAKHSGRNCVMGVRS